MIEFTPYLRSLINQAAEADGAEPTVWLLSTIERAAQSSLDRAAREATRRPAPWNGWTFFPDEMSESVQHYHGPRGALLSWSAPDPLVLSRWTERGPGAKRRWWMRSPAGPLVNARGGLRTFATAEAAIAAFYASSEFKRGEA